MLFPASRTGTIPGFFAYFAITGSAPGILAEFLSAALNLQAMLWRTSPAATELEEVALGWLRHLIGPARRVRGRHLRHGVDLDAARAGRGARARGCRRSATQGLAGRSDVARLRVYCSEQAHSSIDKAVILLGLGQESLRKIPSDAEFRMRPDALARRDRRGSRRRLAAARRRRDGRHDVDDQRRSGARDRGALPARGIWLHVDAAYAGVAAMVPGYEASCDGAEHADSLVVNPHKWLFTPFDLSVLYCRHMDVAARARSR